MMHTRVDSRAYDGFLSLPSGDVCVGMVDPERCLYAGERGAPAAHGAAGGFSMSVVLTSRAVVAPQDNVDRRVAQGLQALAHSGVPVAVVSNHSEPSWFRAAFPSNEVDYVHLRGRQDGSVIKGVASKYNLEPYDFLVLGGSNEDVQMAKNGGAVLVSAGWLPPVPSAGYGVSAGSIDDFREISNLVAAWPGAWYFEGTEDRYSVNVLADVSGKNVTTAQASWANRIVNIVKGGHPRLQALLAVAARSLLRSGIARQSDVMFGLYPSSNSSNDDSDILSDFTHRLRTTTVRSHFAKKGTPLFVRHTPSTKRSRAGSIDRTDPSEQMQTLHLNPYYRNKVRGRNVVIIDDCTTYGVSFGVAAAFLRAAGAKSIRCMALGKFGNQLRYYAIDEIVDPFAPAPRKACKYTERMFTGTTNNSAQHSLRELVK